MKVTICFLAAVASVVAGEAPYPAASESKPSGGLLVVPARQVPLPANQYGPPSPQYGPPANNVDPSAKATETSELERLKAKEGSESGVYHVLLPDGRLQKVEYATAPLKEDEGKAEKEAEVEAVPAWPVRYFDIQTYSGALPARSNQEQPVMVMARPAAYVASVRYSDVEPVAPPVYTYRDSASPLVRIIRK